MSRIRNTDKKNEEQDVPNVATNTSQELEDICEIVLDFCIIIDFLMLQEIRT